MRELKAPCPPGVSSGHVQTRGQMFYLTQNSRGHDTASWPFALQRQHTHTYSHTPTHTHTHILTDNALYLNPQFQYFRALIFIIAFTYYLFIDSILKMGNIVDWQICSFFACELDFCFIQRQLGVIFIVQVTVFPLGAKRRE